MQWKIYHRREGLSRYDSNKVSLSVTSLLTPFEFEGYLVCIMQPRICATLDRHKNTIVKDVYLAVDNDGRMEKLGIINQT